MALGFATNDKHRHLREGH